MKKLFLLLMAVMLTSAVALAQRTVTGTVVYAGDGEPLSGATVQPVGGGSGVATDIDGKFSLTVPANVKRLTVSYIGMTPQTVDITGQPLNISLHNSDTDLDEVMVVAYGTSTRSAFTGSATVVDAAELEKATVTNALNALNGKVAGTQIYNVSGQPGEGPSNIIIRGISSLNAGNDPLVVLNGVPFGGSISAINPADIESMTVLKDAASNALYGARGANGVILITTKSAKGATGAKVTLDAKWGSNSRAVPSYNTIDDPRLYYETYYGALYNYYVNEQGMTPNQAWQAANNNMIGNENYGLGYQSFTYPTNEFFIGRNGKVNPLATPGALYNYNGREYWVQPDNWLDEVYGSSMRQEYNVSVANSTETTNFYASFGYLKNEGIIANTSYERLTGRLTADSQIKTWLKVGGDMTYSHTNNRAMSSDGSSTSVANPLGQATSVGPIYPMYLRDGNHAIMTNADGLTEFDFGDGANAGLYRPGGAAGGSNGMAGTLYNTNRINGNAVNATGFAEIRFLRDFKFTTNNTVYVSESRSNFLGNPYFGSYKPEGGYVSVSHSRYMNYAFQQLLNWNRSFGVHNAAVLLGHENSWIKTTSLGASKSNIFSPTNPELNNAVIDNQSAGSYTSAYDNEGYFLRAQYDYDSKYFANFSFRRDASSRFHPDHRWGNFWSIGAAWIISKEDFFNADWVNNLKIKVSYGEQGNDNIGNYRYTNNYTIVNVNGKPSVSASSVKGNPDITWEKNGNFNAGFEFGLFNNRLSGSFDGFYRKTTGMLYQKPLPASSGFSNIYENFGDMMNAGVELDLHGTIFTSRDLTWDVNFNLTWYKNKVLRLPDTNKSTEYEGHEGTETAGWFVGEGLPMYTYCNAKYAGVDPEDGRPLFWKNVLDDKGNITGREKVHYDENPSRYLSGSPIPKVYGGFGTSLTFKGFDLAVDFTYQLGGKIEDSNYGSYMMAPYGLNNGYAFHADVLKSWTPANTGSSIPRFQFGDNVQINSDQYFTSASYLSLQNINLGYTLPATVSSKIQLESVRFYVSAENVWLWSARQGFDPRQYGLGNGTSALTGGNTYYSSVRTISGGLTVTF